jgi:hypothetical protein
MEVTILKRFAHLALVFAFAFVFNSLPQAAAQVHLLDDPGTGLSNRFGKVPASGVHPRVLIGPKELTSLRQAIHSTETGKFVLARMETYLDAIHVQGKPLAAVYDGLVKGDKNALTSAQTNWWRDAVPFAVSMECYDAMLAQDETRGKRAASALATLASIPRNWWANDSDLVNLAMSYDFDYPYMTEDQRTLLRQTIAAAIAGKKPFGSDMPADWDNYNWMPRGTGLLLAALAIEGEKGYDPSLYPATLGVMKNFLNFGITKEGGPLEEMHYFHYGMQLGALAMVAFARHGDDLFADPHYRALPNWLIASMEPFGNAFSMHQDTPNDQGGVAANYVVMKWTWTADPVVDMVWRNRVQTGFGGLEYQGDWLSFLLFPVDPHSSSPYKGKNPQTKWGIDETVKPTDYPNPVAGIEALKLPLTYWDADRGLLITRNKWGVDGMALSFDMNVQATGGGSHFHSNSGMFTLSALERKWAVDRGFHIAETKDNSLILIDGRGQGFFPVGGKTAEFRDEANLTVVAGDASDPYHWMTRAQAATSAAAVKSFQWEPDMRDANVRRYSELASADKQHPWNDKAAASQYVYRASYNPVQKAFRTVALRRSAPHAYVLILDDIKKDNNSHQYDWLMQVPDDLTIKSTRDQGVILGTADPKDNRRLLVQMISVQGSGKWALEDYEVKRTPETGDTTSFGNGKRLKFTTQTVDPAFKVLLYPYREGSLTPQVSSSGPLEVNWPDQKDKYELNSLPTGRTEIHFRAGQ